MSSERGRPARIHAELPGLLVERAGLGDDVAGVAVRDRRALQRPLALLLAEDETDRQRRQRRRLDLGPMLEVPIGDAVLGAGREIARPDHAAVLGRGGEGVEGVLGQVVGDRQVAGVRPDEAPDVEIEQVLLLVGVAEHQVERERARLGQPQRLESDREAALRRTVLGGERRIAVDRGVPAADGDRGPLVAGERGKSEERAREEDHCVSGHVPLLTG